MRVCKKKKVFWDKAKTKSSTIIWYWCEPGAKYLPGPTRFTSETFDQVHWFNDGAGEDDRTPSTYYNGANPWGFDGTHFCGNLEWFANGAPSDAPPLARNADGSPRCCAFRIAGEGCQCGTGQGYIGPIFSASGMGCACLEGVGGAFDEAFSDAFDVIGTL